MTATSTAPSTESDHNGPPFPVLLGDRLAHWAATTPEATAFSYLSRTFTWAQWHERVRRNAGGLRALGIGRGDIVAFLDKNHPACVETTMAGASIGAATAIVNWRLAGDEVDFVVNDSGARVLFVGAELAPLVDSLREKLTDVEHVIVVTPEGGPDDAYEQWLEASEPAEPDPAVSPEDVCLVMYSSGTTGRPKGVMLSHRNLLSHTANAHDGWSFEPGDAAMVSMPLFHVGGSSYVQFAINDGVHAVMTREADAASLAGALLAGATRTFLVPAVLAQVLQGGPDAVALFGRLKTYTYGAAPMPLPLLRAAMEAWPDTDFLQVYGLTEVCGVATQLSADDHRAAIAGDHPERLVSAGRPIPGVEVRVVHPESLEDLPTGEHGEIWLRSPQVFTGYLGRPEETESAITAEGWFRTGDLGKVDADGYVFVEDRLKDMIISGGENIYSPEVERVLAEHPAIMEVAVIGVPDDQWGESVKAVVSFHEGASATDEELIAYCRDRLARFKCPRTIDVVDLLPRNPTGKILKRDLRQPYWAGRSSAV